MGIITINKFLKSLLRLGIIVIFMSLIIYFFFEKKSSTTNDKLSANKIVDNNGLSDNNPVIITSQNLKLKNNANCIISIVQTRYKKPLTPNDSNFDFYKSKYFGEFSLISKSLNGNLLDTVNLNTYFEKRDMGFIGQFSLKTYDYNNDGNPDFPIGEVATGEHSKTGEFQYVLLSVNEDGKIINLPIEGYYLYDQNNEHSPKFTANEQGDLSVSNAKKGGGGYEIVYFTWNGTTFIKNANKPTKTKYETNTYFDEKFKFSVDYPKEWNFEIFKYIEPSQYHNGSPNSGIKIFIGENKKDFIYVHRSVSQIQIKGSAVSLTTWSGLNGNLSIRDISDQNIKDIAFRLEDTRNGFIGATGQVHNDNYNKYEEQIMNIIKSIKLQPLTSEKVE